MSQGLLDFLNIEKCKLNWMEYITTFLDTHSIDYIIDSDHVKFKLLFLNFEIWSEYNFFVSKIEKSICSPELRKKLDIFLFGFVSDISFIRYSSTTELLNFIRNMNKIVNMIKIII